MTRSRTQEKKTPATKNISDVTNMNQDTPKSSVKTPKVMLYTQCHQLFRKFCNY